MAVFVSPIDLPGWTLLEGPALRVPRQLRYAGASFVSLRLQRENPAPVRIPAPSIVRTIVPPVDDSLGQRTVIELQLNAFKARRVAQAITFGLPTFYFVLDGLTSTPFDSGDVLPAGTLIGNAAGANISCAGQDRISRDPALWSAQIAAADPSATTWAAFAAAVATQTASGSNPPILLLDHAGAPLADEDVQITRGSQTVTAGSSPPTAATCSAPSRACTRPTRSRCRSRRSSRPAPGRCASPARPAPTPSSGVSRTASTGPARSRSRRPSAT